VSNQASPFVGRSSPLAFMPLIVIFHWIPITLRPHELRSWPFWHNHAGWRSRGNHDPMETCALTAVPVAKSNAASSIALTRLLILFSLPDIVRTKGCGTSGSAIFDCERYSWPQVQACRRLRNWVGPGKARVRAELSEHGVSYDPRNVAD